MLAGLSEWLDAYREAWEARDPQAACELFSEDAEYQWSPFEAKLRGRVMIREAWAEMFEAEPETEFGYEVLAATDRSGIVRWEARAGQTKLEGIFKLAFEDTTGLCKNLKAWWNAAP